jgi:hypothetical protein
VEYFYNQKKDYGYYDQPIHPTGQSMATAAMVAGIICIATFWTVYLPIVIGGLGMVFAFLSKGFEKKLSNNAKVGFIFSAIGFSACTIFLAVGIFYLLNNPERFVELGQQLDTMGAGMELGFSYEESVKQIIDMLR